MGMNRAAERIDNPTQGGRRISQPEQARHALPDRRWFSIRGRITAVSILLGILMSTLTVAVIIFLSEFKTRSVFLEAMTNYAFEIEQARRFEKNFFFYGTNLDDALAHTATARYNLDRNAGAFESVVGEQKLAAMKEMLRAYERLLESLGESDAGERSGKQERAQIESGLRRNGTRLLEDAEESVNRERLQMHTMLHTSRLLALVFLLFMLLVTAYTASLIMHSVLRPLERFMGYAARIGKGDYSPIVLGRKYRDEYSYLAMAINQMLHELQAREDQLRQSVKMAAVGTLTSGIAHELNNPLNNIALNTESLLDSFSELGEEQKLRMLEQIYAQVERASSTVRSLLDFTRREPLTFAATSLAKEIRHTAGLAVNELELAGVDLDLELDDDLPQVMGNPRNLQQVFLNLILNAIQAMPGGGRIRVRGAVENDFVRVDVSDNGCGIPREHLDKVFDPFFTTKETGEGTGLGLSVSYGIVEKHGGRITVESELGEGTTFSVYLPVARDHS
jgi:two-component system, NtrC family, sensor kinase